MSLSRKQRRETAKKMGYLSQNNSFKDFAQRLERSHQAGDMIHKRNLEEQRWEMKKMEELKERERLMSEINAQRETTKEQEFTFDSSSFDFLNRMGDSEDLPG